MLDRERGVYREDILCAWDDQELFGPSENEPDPAFVSLQLDVEQGTLTMFKGQRFLGCVPQDLDLCPDAWEVPTRIPGANFCWVVGMYAEGAGKTEGAVRIRSVPPIL